MVQRGFTLIELLVAMTIVAILSAIAIPQFAQYRARAFDTRAVSDLRNSALAEEVYYLDYEKYRSCEGTGCRSLPGFSGPSPGVSLEIAATASGFTGEALHQRGSGRLFRWDSNAGGLQE